MTTPELKRCPFCGADDIAKVYKETGNEYFLGCTDCGARGPETSSKEMAVWAWQTRYVGNTKSEDITQTETQNLCHIDNNDPQLSKDDKPPIMVEHPDNILRLCPSCLSSYIIFLGRYDQSDIKQFICTTCKHEWKD